MAEVRVEKDVLITVPSAVPGSAGEQDGEEHISLREADRDGYVLLNASKYGTEVAIDDLMEGLGKAEEHFERPTPPDLRAA